jgi:protein tyrosine phosphatase (PTP) superfamily phosphohydrolase (DUF442 family)
MAFEKLLLIFISTFLLGPSLWGDSLLPKTVTSADVKTHAAWGNLQEVKQVGGIYLSRPPNKKALLQFKKNKVQSIVDLRTFKEKDCDSMTAAVQLGMKYHNVSFDKEAPIQKSTLDEIDKIVAENGDKPILIYCESGNRSAAWLAIYLARTGRATPQESLAIAKLAGLTSPMMEEKVQDYLKISPQ